MPGLIQHSEIFPIKNILLSISEYKNSCSTIRAMKIKISMPGDYPSADLTQFLGTRMSSHEFYFNCPIESADAWFIIEGTLPNDTKCLVPENRVFFLGAETARSVGFYYETPGWLEYLKQFAGIYSPQELFWKNAVTSIPFLPWMINSNHGPNHFAKSSRDIDFFRNLNSLEKTREISVFCSSQYMTADHRARFRFVSALKDYFGTRLDWFGNGINPLKQKWDGLAPYKYTIVLENQSSSWVLTEKIQGAFLALAVPIYWGAPQVKDIFSDKAFVSIDIKDLKGSIALIEELLERDDYELRLSSLIEAKTIVTDKLNFLFRIEKILEDSSLQDPVRPVIKTISPLDYFTPSPHLVDKVIRKVFPTLSKILRRLRRI